MLAWEAVEAHWDDMQEHWPSNTIHRMLEALAALAAAGEGAAQWARAWLDAHPLPRGELKLRQARERLAINLAFKKRTAALLRARARTQPRLGELSTAHGPLRGGPYMRSERIRSMRGLDGSQASLGRHVEDLRPARRRRPLPLSRARHSRALR